MRVPILSALAFIIISCNNSTDTSATKEKTRIDSLQEQVDDGHIAGMAKMGKLTKYQQRVNQLVDSLSKLPAKAKAASEPYRQKLDSLLKDLNYAEFSMDKWMNEFYSKDTSMVKPEERMKFLEAEKDKVAHVKEAILNSIARADSLLK